MFDGGGNRLDTHRAPVGRPLAMWFSTFAASRVVVRAAATIDVVGRSRVAETDAPAI